MVADATITITIPTTTTTTIIIIIILVAIIHSPLPIKSNPPTRVRALQMMPIDHYFTRHLPPLIIIAMTMTMFARISIYQRRQAGAYPGSASIIIIVSMTATLFITPLTRVRTHCILIPDWLGT
jgi:hypothetical protein